MFIFPSGIPSGASGYQPKGAVWFDGSADYLSWTPSGAGNAKKWTLSFWLKRSKVDSSQVIFGSGDWNADYTSLYFSSSGVLNFDDYSGGSAQTRLVTNALFRDPISWYSIILSYDSTPSTPSSSSIKLIINGTQITSFSTETYASQNDDTTINTTAAIRFGDIAVNSPSLFLNGYLADIVFLDDHASSDASEFGELSDGIWVPKDPSGISSFGTNGFWLDFADGTDIGNDVSGNNNDFTANSMGEYSVVADGPANNTDNEVITHPTVLSWDTTDTIDGGSFSNNNRTYVSSSGNYTWVCSTFKLSSGKWYWEVEADAGTSERVIGISNQHSTSASFELGKKNGQVGYRGSDSGSIQSGYSSGYSTVESSAGAISNGNIIGIALDLDSATQTVKFYNNNSLVYTHNLHNDQKPSVTGLPLMAAVGDVDSGATATFIGYFHADNLNYSVPSGYNALSSSSMARTVTGVGNYCVWNPLTMNINASSSLALSNGNLVVKNTASEDSNVHGSFGLSSGKWYFEVTVNTLNEIFLGVSDATIASNANSKTEAGAFVLDLLEADKYNNDGGSSYGSEFVKGSVANVAIDLDNGKIWIGKDGTYPNSGNPATGSNEMYSGISGTVFPFLSTQGSGTKQATTNFGQTGFITTPPTGFKAVATQNLPELTYSDPSVYFQTKLWTGNGSDARALTFDGNSDLQPDLIWIKNRDDSADHVLFDSVRGFSTSTTGTQISSNLSAAEDSTTGGHVQSVQSDGFTLKDGTAGNADHNVNNSSDDYVAWCWKAGGAPTADNTGDRTPTNNSVMKGGTAQTATNYLASSVIYPKRMSIADHGGFSIVKWTASGSAAQHDTLPHGLSVTPQLVFIKDIGQSKGWRAGAYNGSTWLTGFVDNGSMATAGAASELSDMTSTHLKFGAAAAGFNEANQNYIAYFWGNIEGVQKFGVYTGNGSTDGPFIYLGFKPSLFIVKRISGTANWLLMDGARNTYNPVSARLNADSANDESTVGASNYDFLANGVKLRNDAGSSNTGSQAYIYAAFAAMPFALNNRAR